MATAAATAGFVWPSSGPGLPGRAGPLHAAGQQCRPARRVAAAVCSAVPPGSGSRILPARRVLYGGGGGVQKSARFWPQPARPAGGRVAQPLVFVEAVCAHARCASYHPAAPGAGARPMVAELLPDVTHHLDGLLGNGLC